MFLPLQLLLLLLILLLLLLLLLLSLFEESATDSSSIYISTHNSISGYLISPSLSANTSFVTFKQYNCGFMDFLMTSTSSTKGAVVVVFFSAANNDDVAADDDKEDTVLPAHAIAIKAVHCCRRDQRRQDDVRWFR